MGNRIGGVGAGAGAGIGNEGEPSSQFNTRRRYQQHKREFRLEDEYRSKTLPARHPHQQEHHHQAASHGAQSRLGSSSYLGGGAGGGSASATNATPNSGETSRVLFLLYLIHRTWNVVMDTMDTRTKSRTARTASTPKEMPVELQLHRPQPDEEASIGMTTTDMDASSYCSQYSCCSCSYCERDTAGGTHTNVYSSIADDYSMDSIYNGGKSVAGR